MFKNPKESILVSKSSGNIDDCNPIQWLKRHFPKALEEPGTIERASASIEMEDGIYIITTYTLSKTYEKYLKVRIKWDLQVEGERIELWSTIYSSIKCPKDPDNLKEVALAKSKLLMVAETYSQSMVAALNINHKLYNQISQNTRKFIFMKEFVIDATPTGRIRSFTVTTQEKDKGSPPNTYVLQNVISPYFTISKINDYESKAIILDNEYDRLFYAVSKEKEGQVSRFLIDYYSVCCQRLGQTFEEAYTRFIDTVAEDQVQNSIQDLRKMESGIHQQDYTVEQIKKKFNTVIRFIKEHYESSRSEYEIMNEAFSYLEKITDKFDSWRDHPDLSLAQTSLIEAKIEQLSKRINEKRVLLIELKRRFDKIEYWAKWFKKEFPTLFSKLED